MYECKDGVCYLKPSTNCKNHMICQNRSYREDRLCLDCYNIFGEWRSNQKTEVIMKDDNDKCPVCEEDDKTVIYRMNCDHFVCVDCFKKIYYGIELKKPQIKLGNNLEDYKEQLERYEKMQNIYILSSDKFSSKCFECFEC